ncbi:MAG TPA: hypothetical protein VMR33_11985 [Candidatus Baltobacteraceae bacterium]|jgi:hypothetical protein|nr:hypothetical protein [Candidatus Baltobacteraceae bacterium]
MKKRIGAAAVLVLVGVAFYFFFNSKKIPSLEILAPTTQELSAARNAGSPGAAFVSSAQTDSNSEAISSQGRPQPGSLAARAGQFVPDSSPPADLSPETVMQNVRRAIRQYGEMFGGNPVGTNPEITSQLSGNNPRHIDFITAQAGMRVDADGELIDAWGTPYFFHQISGAETEVHSAGPDKIMWTPDDLVVK